MEVLQNLLRVCTPLHHAHSARNNLVKKGGKKHLSSLRVYIYVCTIHTCTNQKPICTIQYIVLHNTLTRGSGLCITLYSYVRGREPKKKKKKIISASSNVQKKRVFPLLFYNLGTYFVNIIFFLGNPPLPPPQVLAEVKYHFFFDDDDDIQH